MYTVSERGLSSSSTNSHEEQSHAHTRAHANAYTEQPPTWGSSGMRVFLLPCGVLHNAVGHKDAFLRHGNAVSGKCLPCCWYGVTNFAEITFPVSPWSLIKAINKPIHWMILFLWFNLQLPSCSFTHTNSLTTKPHHRKFTSQVPPPCPTQTHMHTHTLSGTWKVTDCINHTSQSELAMRCSLV